MENNAITPQAVTQLTTLQPDEIASLSEQVMDATRVGNQAVEELDNLSKCMSEFVEVQERYCKAAKKVRSQMRYVNNHL